MPHVVKTGATYRHYKNLLVKVIGIALHSETKEELVIYEKLEDFGEYKKGSLWARPKKMFLEKVTINGETLPRFSLVKS
jgi:hypothetical protein